MVQVPGRVVRVDAEKLRNFTRDVLELQGVPRDDASYVAWHLVETNLRGTDSHGVARLPHYVRRLRAGSIRAQPALRFERRGPTLGVVDGDHGLGFLVMRRAADEAAALARENGSAWVAVCNSSHCGALAPYGLRLAALDMVSFAFTHVDPMVLPHGAAEAFCGTNPLCITAPGAGDVSLCLDMATSIVPWNVVANAQREGLPIPLGWAVDKAGNDTTDASSVNALYPCADYKGSGLGLMIDVLCAMFSGAPYGPDIPKMYGDLSQHRQLGGLVGAIDVAAFTSAPEFRRRVAEMMSRLCGLKPVRSTGRVLFPGQVELETKVNRQALGIPVGSKMFAELNALATDLKVAELEPISE